MFSVREGCAFLAALPRTVMLIYGFAWLNSGDANSITKTFIRLSTMLGLGRTGTRYICGTSQYFSQLYRENSTLEAAIKFHLTAREKKMDWKSRAKLTWLRLNSVIFKMFYAIPDFAYSLETRHNQQAYDATSPLRIKRIVLEQFQPDQRTPPIDIEHNIEDVASHVLDLSGVSYEVGRAIVDVTTGIVPHIRGSVKGVVELTNGENLLDWPQEKKFQLVRYVGGASDAKQLLGPTVDLEMRGSSPDAKSIRSALEYWQLLSLRHRRIQELSGGQRARLALASAWASRTPVIVLDSVEDQLDSNGRERLYDLYFSENSAIDKLIIRRSQKKTLAREGTPRGLEESDKPPLATSSVIIAADGIRLERGGVTLLNNWSHEFREGTVTVITGANGVGKTSLALLLGGVLQTKKGNVLRYGPIGMSFQAPLEQIFRFLVIEELMVRPSLADAIQNESESMAYALAKREGIAPSEETVRLSPVQLRLISALSMQYRTKCLILDEPSSGLSGEEIGAVVRLIERLRSERSCVIVISHDPHLWPADEVLRLERQR